MTLSPDEKTVLLIAAEGEPMMPIGRWRASATTLVEKGFLKPRPHPGDPDGFFNLHITPAGRKAVEDVEKEDDEALRDLINTSAGLAREQSKLRAFAEKIAVDLASIAEQSATVTGDSREEALRNWARVILERALEIGQV